MMTKITLDLDDPAAVASSLHRHGYEEVAAQIKAQLPTPPPEPHGDTLLLVFGVVYRRQDNGEWWPFIPGPGYEWPDLIEECDRTNSVRPVVYRPEPSPERVEEQVQWLTESWDVGRERLDELAGEFARRLLGGEG